MLELSAKNLAGLERHMRDAGWLLDGEVLVGAEPAGAGNMNRTLRVHSNRRSVFVKQSVPFVAKYPDIPAPVDRDRIEAAFYQTIQCEAELAAAMPKFLGHLPEQHLLCLEDLGPAGDFTSGYTDHVLPDLDLLLAWLGKLHQQPITTSEFSNHAMRALNHEHLFVIPFSSDNGLDLDGITPGLAAVAAAVATDRRLLETVGGLGEQYLHAASGVLLHGDFYPGSWMQHATGPKVIDPEFAFVGPAEFDVGVLLAHARLCRLDADLRPYAAPPGFDLRLAEQFAAIEVLRRLLGVAQLPLAADLETKRGWVEAACGVLR